MNWKDRIENYRRMLENLEVDYTKLHANETELRPKDITDFAQAVIEGMNQRQMFGCTDNERYEKWRIRMLKDPKYHPITKVAIASYNFAPKTDLPKQYISLLKILTNLPEDNESIQKAVEVVGLEKMLTELHDKALHYLEMFCGIPRELQTTNTNL
ncbi:hypothetical protein HYV49_02385 [Candidatus Pacearchaeota archaeon]|nr:hypothetical protein [Candidatus Pacearchaeota archaeon]